MKMGREIVLGLLVILVSGCNSLPQDNKRLWEKVSCGSTRGWDSCMSVAAKACQKGFDIRHQEEDIVTQKRRMEFACK